jgi:[ribosomal protein S5]-alanine N-acetyltransferase
LVLTPPSVLTTSRLILRAARREDAACLFENYTGRSDASHYLQRSAHASQKKTEAVIDAWGADKWATSERFVWSVLLRSEQMPVGLFLMFLDGNNAEIHYGIGPSFWGQGLASEAGGAIMEWVVQRSSLSEVSTCCAVDHIASLRVLEKIGLSRIELLPNELLLGSAGSRVDAWLYRWERSS